MVEEVVIYHNPRCSKSRKTLELIKEKGYDPQIKLYLEEPIKNTELLDIIARLGCEATDLIRENEQDYKDLVKVHGKPNNSKAREWILKYPNIMQRPIVKVNGSSAVIGRPPENVLSIL